MIANDDDFARGNIDDHDGNAEVVDQYTDFSRYNNDEFDIPTSDSY